MLEWVGSLRLRQSTSMRVVLSLSWSTRLAGLLCVLIGAYLTLLAWQLSPFIAILPGLITLLGSLLCSLQRTLVVDRANGVLELEQRVFGIRSRTVVPLFHLRAVVVIAPAAVNRSGVPSWLLSPTRYVAYLDRRKGDAIYLDESRRCARLMSMAEAIAEVAELRLEYDAMSHAGE